MKSHKETPDTTGEKKSKCKEEEFEQRYRLSPKTRWLVFKITAIVFLILVASIVLFIFIKKFTKVHSEVNTSLINSQLKYCQELVVGEYSYSDVVALKKSAGISKSYSIIKYNGIIRSGIEDVNKITYSISNDGRKITLKIPPAQLLGNEIISQDIFDEKQSVFVRITTQEIFDEICQAKARVGDMLIARGLLDDSWHHAATIVEQFMYGLGFDEVVVKIG